MLAALALLLHEASYLRNEHVPLLLGEMGQQVLHVRDAWITAQYVVRRLAKLALHAVGGRGLLRFLKIEVLQDLREFLTPRTSSKIGDAMFCGALAEPELAQRMWHLNDVFAATGVHPGELLSVMALDRLPQIAARARQLLDISRQAVNAFLDARRDLLCFCPAFGTVVFPKLRRGSVDEFCNLLRDKYETSVVPGQFFEMPRHFRVGMGGDMEMPAEGLRPLASALDEYGKGAKP